MAINLDAINRSAAAAAASPEEEPTTAAAPGMNKIAAMFEAIKETGTELMDGNTTRVTTDGAAYERLIEKLRTPEMTSVMGEIPDDLTGADLGRIAERVQRGPEELREVMTEQMGPLSPENIYYSQKRMNAMPAGATAKQQTVVLRGARSKKEKKQMEAEHRAQHEAAVARGEQPGMLAKDILKVDPSIKLKTAVLMRPTKGKFKTVKINADGNLAAIGQQLKVEDIDQLETSVMSLVTADDRYNKGPFKGRGFAVHWNSTIRTHNKPAEKLFKITAGGDILLMFADGDFTEADVKNIPGYSQ